MKVTSDQVGTEEAVETQSDVSMLPTPPSRFRMLISACNFHRAFFAVLLGGIALRLLCVVAYRGALMFYGDSYFYIASAQRGAPLPERPFLYPAFIRALSHFGDVSLIAISQHVIGVLLAIMVYRFLINRNARRWLAVLVASPLLLDAYVLQLEHQVLTETLFAALILISSLLLLRTNPSKVTIATSGVLLSAAVLTRSVAIAAVIIFILYLLVKKFRPITIGIFVTAFILPAFVYAAGFSNAYGSFGAKDAVGRWLYGRVIVFADCSKLALTTNERKLCDPRPPEQRPNANTYLWSPQGTIRKLNVDAYQADLLAKSFAIKTIKAQPLTYLRYAGNDTLHYFAPGHPIYRTSSALDPWRFPLISADPHAGLAVAHNNLSGDPVKPQIDRKSAQVLRAYQNVAFTPGPLLFLCVVLAIGASVKSRRRTRWDGSFLALSALSMLAFSSATVMFDYRYLVPCIGLIALAGGLALLELFPRISRENLANEAPVDETKASASGLLNHRAVMLGIVTSIVIVTALVVWAPLKVNILYARYAGDPKAELGWLGPAISSPQIIDLGDELGSRVDYVGGSMIESRADAYPVPASFVTAIERGPGFTKLGGPEQAPQELRNRTRIQKFKNGTVVLLQSNNISISLNR